MKHLKKDTKIKSSLHLTSLIILSVCLIFIILNICFNIITKGVYLLFPINKSEMSEIIINVISYVLISIMAILSIIRLIVHWDNTKCYRDEKKELKIRSEAMAHISSKELLEMAKEKDKLALEQILKENNLQGQEGNI